LYGGNFSPTPPVATLGSGGACRLLPRAEGLANCKSATDGRVAMPATMPRRRAADKGGQQKPEGAGAERISS
jgi:hypothetical protein